MFVCVSFVCASCLCAPYVVALVGLAAHEHLQAFLALHDVVRCWLMPWCLVGLATSVRVWAEICHCEHVSVLPVVNELRANVHIG